MAEANARLEGTDTGYIFAGPVAERRTKRLKDGATLTAYHQDGVVITDLTGSPWHGATCFGQGTNVKDGNGRVVVDVALYEMIDGGGDLSWSIAWRPAGGPGSLQLEGGTGKWEGIAGGGTVGGLHSERADDHIMPSFEITWRAEQSEGQGEGHGIDAAAYTDHDIGLSFHGPHLTERIRELKNGVTLIASNQSGVLISENLEARSPRHYATNFDRGTTIRRDGETLGDVMLLEDTDSDGDTVWLSHAWWYGKGPGSYRFIGGTGKWEGIVGEGRTLGMLRQRNDDHYMLRSEIYWRIG